MSKGIPATWPAAVASARIKQLMRQDCPYLVDATGGPAAHRGHCPCAECRLIRDCLFGSTDPLPRNPRGYVWRDVQLRGVPILSREQTQKEITVFYDRREPRTHPDLF